MAPLETLSSAARQVTWIVAQEVRTLARDGSGWLCSGRAYLLCLSPPLPRATLPGHEPLQLVAVTPAGLGLGSMAGDLLPLGSQAGVIFWSLLFAVEQPWHFRDRDLR